MGTLMQLLEKSTGHRDVLGCSFNWQEMVNVASRQSILLRSETLFENLLI